MFSNEDAGRDGEDVVSEAPRPRRKTRKQRIRDRRAKERAEYERRKLDEECTRCGADVKGLDDQLCPECRKYTNDKAAESMSRLRERRRSKRKCALCGKPSKRYECIACLIKLGKAPIRAVNQAINQHGAIHAGRKGGQVRAVLESDGRVRTRNVGQAKRGRIPHADNDEQGARHAQKELEAAITALLYAHSPEVKELPRIQARDILHAALSRVVLVQRLLDVILDRHNYVR